MPNPDTPPSAPRDTFQHLTQDNLDQFRRLLDWPSDSKLNSLTLAELVAYAQTRSRDGSDAQADADDDVDKRYPPPATRIALSDCDKKFAAVIIDAVLLLVGGIKIRDKVKQAAVDEVSRLKLHLDARDFQRVMNYLERGDLKDKAWCIVRIVGLVGKAGLAGAIWNAIVKSLTWYDMVLYGVEGAAELVAFLATDGVAAVMLIIQEIARGAWTVVNVTEFLTGCPDYFQSFMDDDAIPVYLEGYKAYRRLVISNLVLGPPPPGLRATTTFTQEAGVTLRLLRPHGAGPLRDGDIVWFQTTESAAGDHNLLSYDNLYGNVAYTKDEWPSTWQLRHPNSSRAGTLIFGGEAVRIIPVGMPNRVLMSDGTGLFAGQPNPPQVPPMIPAENVWTVNIVPQPRQ